MSLQVREEALPHPGTLLHVPPEGTRPVGRRGSPRNRWNLREALGGWWEEPGAQWGWGKGARGGRPHVQGGTAHRAGEAGAPRKAGCPCAWGLDLDSWVHLLDESVCL